MALFRLFAASVALFAVLASGCQTVDPDRFTSRPWKVSEIVVHWAQVENVDAACQKIAPSPKPYHACAWVQADRKKCVVFVPENAPVAHLGHEVKHCFGYRHD